MTHRHGCVIVDRISGNIVASGFNYHNSHLFHRFSIHAEVDALMKIKKSVDMSGYDMYVVRLGPSKFYEPKNLELKFSRPCEACTRAILKSNIGRVYYSITSVLR
jgi:deoxycytidylate deaminase